MPGSNMGCAANYKLSELHFSVSLVLKSAGSTDMQVVVLIAHCVLADVTSKKYD